MELKEVQQYLEAASELISPDAVGDDINVAFEVQDETGRPRYVHFNICTVYTESRLIVFSLEGPVVEIFHMPIASGEESNV